ncbi:MAG TPA: DivIVA domain-containing protein [Candidatus Dormibacteraeota bacterium]|jgi:cell division septum initiation protein DivIVA
MSLVEHGPASSLDAEIRIPEFPVALRGYERQQVDTFLKDLSIRVTAERRRAEQAERGAAQMRAELAGLRNQAPPSFEHLGAEAGRVLEQAGTSAKLLVEEARSRGRALVEEAEGQAQDLIERADRRAAEVEAEARDTLADATSERERILAEAAIAVEEARNQAREDVHNALEQAREAASRTHQKAMSEQARMEAETERLRESRDRMLEYLGRIHTDLGALLAEAVQADVEMDGRRNGGVSMETEDGEDGQDEEDGEEDGDDDEEARRHAGSSYRVQ